MAVQSSKIPAPDLVRVRRALLSVSDKTGLIEFAKGLASQPRLAVEGVLKTVVGFESKTLAESIQDEQRAVKSTRGTADAQEGMRAFLEKRKPVFNQSA